jgi:hypothetical protein
MGRVRLLVGSLVVATAFAAPSGAAAATTIGSALTANTAGTNCATNTFLNVQLAVPNQVPFDGAIVRWRVKLPAAGGAHTYRLRVLRPAGGTSFTAVGSGPFQQAPSMGVNVIALPTPIPVKQGDLIGVDCDSLGGAPSPFSNAAPATSVYGFFSGGLADGTTGSPSSFSNSEELINADVAPTPPNDFSFGKVTRNSHRGTATLLLNLPGPGAVALAGKGIKGAQVQASGGSRSAATTTKLVIRAKGKSKRALESTGTAKVKASVTYTPSGEISGIPKTLARKLKLTKR